jgi:Outer membrane protein beta-barrel domain
MVILAPESPTITCHQCRALEGVSSPLQRLRSLWVTLLSLLVTLLLVLPTANASAQEPPPGLVEVRESGRQGFWLGLGLGAGGESFDLRDGAGYSDAFYQPTVSLRLGGTVSPKLRLGGEVLAWINEEGRTVESLTSVLFVAQFYPIRTTGLYLKGGLGIGRNAVNFDDGFDVGDTGFAGLLGAGYEIRLSRSIYLNPAIDLVGHTYDSRAGGSYRERLVNFGLGILVQTGK